MKKFLEFLSLVRKSLNGDLVYESYLAHAKIHQKDGVSGEILDKKSFLLQRREERSKKLTRCC